MKRAKLEHELRDQQRGQRDLKTQPIQPLTSTSKEDHNQVNVTQGHQVQESDSRTDKIAENQVMIEPSTGVEKTVLTETTTIHQEEEKVQPSYPAYQCPSDRGGYPSRAMNYSRPNFQAQNSYDKEYDLGLAKDVKHRNNSGYNPPINQRLPRTPEALKLVAKTKIEGGGSNNSGSHQSRLPFLGLRPSLVEKLYPLQPKTGEEFLEALKRFTETKLLANRRTWPDAVLGVAATRVADVPIDFIRTLPKPALTAADTESWKVIKELQGVVESLKIQAVPPSKRQGNEKTVTWGESERIYRNNNGVLKCYCCNGTGQMARNCWENPQSTRFRPRPFSGPPGSQREPLGPPVPINIESQLAETTTDSSTQDEIKKQPILRLDFSKLIRKEVTCGTRQVMAVVRSPNTVVANVMRVAQALQAENFCFELSGKLLQTKRVSVGVISGYDGEVLSCGLTTREEDPPRTRPPTKEEVNQRRTLIDNLKKQVNHGIRKTNAPYASPWKASTMVNEQVKSLEEAGIIEISDRSWSAPVVLMRKKDGTWRFCVDYRKLNSVTVRDIYPLPSIVDGLSRLEGAEFFSILDLQAGYHQIPVREENRHKTAFITADGLYQFKVQYPAQKGEVRRFWRKIIIRGVRSGKLYDNTDCLSRCTLPVTEDQEGDRCVAIGLVGSGRSVDFGPEEEFVAEQRRVTRWRHLMDQLEAGRATLKNFCLFNGRLCLQTIKNGKQYRSLCVPRSFWERVVKAYHDDLMSGHMGVRRTLTKISNRFFWERLAIDVTNYVQSCPNCQGRKGVNNRPAGFLQCIQVARPFQKVGNDLLGPFPMSNTGSKMIIVAVDYSTKWVELRVMPNEKADIVARFFVEQMVLRHGAPESIISEQGKCFIAALTEEVMKNLGTSHKTTSSYHPHSNRLVERMNHTLAAMLSMYVSADHRDWDEASLPYVCFAYNTALQESTGYSPFFLLYGREPMLPIDLELGSDANPRLVTKSEIVHVIKMKLFHDLVERGLNLNTESPEATRETPLPNALQPPVRIHRETGTVNGNHAKDSKQAGPPPHKDTAGSSSWSTGSLPALLLPYTICVFAFLGSVKVDALLVRDTVIFNEKPGVAFGESFWTVITDLHIRPAEAVIQTLKVRLKEYSDMAVKCHETGNQQGASAAKKLDVKCRWFERELNQSEHRLAIFRDAIGYPAKQRRAVIDGGGSALKWLFGVATQADLSGLNKKITGLAHRENEIVHLMDQQATVLAQCIQQFKEWKGSQVAYLGGNRWVFSAITAHEVVFSCPICSSQGPPQSLLLPPFGIFDVPPGCTARKEGWVFPASLDGRLEVSLDPLVAPTLAAVGFNVTTFKSVAIIEIPKANATSINFMSDLLRRNDGSLASSEMTGFLIQELLKKMTEEFQLSEPRYPFELLIMLLLLVLATTYLNYKLFG
ncbi:Uncharacterized protein APZ42_018256 [Daphnia magna]|uniref:RNA-directed DNA polymerase n=1 Tax=Daphnia magna TaxID=35525 RepID=A0A162CR23_9CRUS|nr:Uncharacterized protein APZ42_018256 [Daphnia magna]